MTDEEKIRYQNKLGGDWRPSSVPERRRGREEERRRGGEEGRRRGGEEGRRRGGEERKGGGEEERRRPSSLASVPPDWAGTGRETVGAHLIRVSAAVSP